MKITVDHYLMKNYFSWVGGYRLLHYQRLIKNGKRGIAFMNNQVIAPLLESGLYNENELSELLKLSQSELQIELRRRLEMKFGDSIYYNRCPKCNNLVRTPRARQCPVCYYSWHNNARGKFLVKNISGSNKNQLELGGEREWGELEIGMQAILIDHQLGICPRIIELNDKESPS